MEIFAFCITHNYEVIGIEKEVVKRIYESGKKDIVVLHHEGNIFVINYIEKLTPFEVASKYSMLVKYLDERFSTTPKIIIGNVSFDEKFIYETIRLSQYKYISNQRKVINVKIVDKNLNEVKYEDIDKEIENVFNARDLINLSVEYKSPRHIANQLKEDLKNIPSIEIKIIEGEDLKKENLNLLYAVGKGSSNPPMLMIIKYKPNKDEKFYGVVGKGVVFDAGGYNLKLQMIEDMKLDVSGAVIVGYLIRALAQQNIKVNVVAALPLVENVISGKSYKPGDVITSYAKKSVEIVNTDAEGRLIMADALAYLQENYKIDVLIDVSTLTGACMVALGKEVAGIMGDDNLAEKIISCGIRKEERFWKFPMWEEYYRKKILSKVADIKNLNDDKLAGAIIGGVFLKEFIKEGVKWVHLDIAGPSYTKENKLFYYPGATAFSLRTLLEFFKEVEKNG